MFFFFCSRTHPSADPPLFRDFFLRAFLVALLKYRPKKNLNAPWKILSPETDYTPRESYSQYMLRYHEPEEDTNPVEYRSKRGDFSEYIDKAIQLKVNLKSTAH